jgi:hypothetical protein
MSFKKLPFLILLVLFLFLPSVALADLVPMECTSFNGAKPPAYCMYSNYKGPLYPRIFSINPLVGLSLNFILVLSATTVLSFISSKKFEKKIILYSLGLTLLGLIVDSIALFIANGVHNYYYRQYLYTTGFLIDSFFNALFISSFILLSVIYLAIYSRIYKKKINRNIIIISLILALINNPYWFLKYI